MRRHFLLIAGFSLILAGCGGGGGGGGGNGISLARPSVSVLGLEAAQTVTVGLSAGGELLFSSNATRTFTTQVQDGKRYTLSVTGTTGDATCRFANGQQSISSSDASATIPLGCGQVSLPGEGEEEEEGGPVQMSLSLTDALGQAVGSVERPVTSSRPGKARVALTSNGAPISGRIISFSTTLGSLVPSAGTSLTDAQGVAVITLEAAQQGGAGVLTATYQPAGDEDTVVRSVNFQMEASGSGGEEPEERQVLIGRGVGAAFEQGVLELSATDVGAGSTLLATASLVTEDDSQPWTGLAAVTFSSNCVAAGTAEIDASVNAINGRAVSTYRPLAGCVTDYIQAAAVLNGVTKAAVSAQVNIAQAPVNSLQFEAATPSVIGLRGSAQAGVPEVAVLSFLVLDSNGNPVPAGTEVSFEVVAGAGGFTISSGLVSSTNSEGRVTVTVKSGTVPTVGAVRARVAGTEIVGSGSVSVQTGITSQDRFALAVETVNPLAGNHLGEQVEVVVRAADRVGNWVPDGTQINFTTELGDIEASCITQNGGCTVTWTSQGGQTIHYDDLRGGRSCFAGSENIADRQGVLQTAPCGVNDRFGRSTITAWAVGEESFTDPNANNQYELGEPWVPLPEAFRDDNEDGLQTGEGSYAEFFMDFNESGAYDVVPATAFFRGLGCSEEAQLAGHCTELANVRRSALIVLSTDHIEGYVFSDNADFSAIDWRDKQTGGVPVSWGRTVLAGVTDPGGSYSTASINGNTQVTGLPLNSPATLHMVIADTNGNAPALGSSISVSGGSMSVTGPSSCQVANAYDPVMCSFHFSPPETPPTSISPIVVTFRSVSGHEVIRTISLSSP